MAGRFANSNLNSVHLSYKQKAGLKTRNGEDLKGLWFDTATTVRVTCLSLMYSVIHILYSSPSRVTGLGFLYSVIHILYSSPSRVTGLGFLYSVIHILYSSPSRVTGLGFLYSVIHILYSSPSRVTGLGFLYSVMGFLCSSPSRVKGLGFKKNHFRLKVWRSNWTLSHTFFNLKTIMSNASLI